MSEKPATEQLNFDCPDCESKNSFIFKKESNGYSAKCEQCGTFIKGLPNKTPKEIVEEYERNRHEWDCTCFNAEDSEENQITLKDGSKKKKRPCTVNHKTFDL